MKKKAIGIGGAMRRSLAIIMGGGAGSRLFPLTKDRSKPAVPLGGKYRLVDIPISNCINSGLGHIFVLTQYNSASLNQHINAAYKFDAFHNNFVEVLAAQQTPEGSTWYQGTADAVRQNLRYFLEGPYDHFFILSGDQLYNMDFRTLMEEHLTSAADITIATLPVNRERAGAFGIMHTESDGRITRFVEKPSDDSLLDELKMDPSLLKKWGIEEGDKHHQASMGIYLFNRDALVEALDNEMDDFGKDIIPEAIRNYQVQSFVFPGYWEDIGTIRSFFKANLDLCRVVPQYDFFNRQSQIYTNARFLPASKINGASIKEAIISDGCIISEAVIENSVVGLRSVIENGTTIKDSVIMGADYFPRNISPTEVKMGIGRNCHIECAIIDKNARIGDGVTISPHGKAEHVDADNYYIREGVVVIPKGATIAPGSRI
ncbi:MAG: glucose-1-phosphate adenylyltransferase [Verrucomicrobiales bacterium]